VFTVSKQMSFSAAHSISGSGGACERVHGHNWKVVAHVGARKLDRIGMVVDFKVLKSVLKEVIEPLDHSFLNDVAPFDKSNPTSENIAAYILDSLAARLDDGRIRVLKVDVWETDDSMASVERPAQ